MASVTQYAPQQAAACAPPEHLWEHQAAAFSYALNKAGTMLAMGMGSGKSAVAVALLEAWDCRRVLILCPKSVAQVWPGQFRQHARAGEWSVLTLDAGSIEQRRTTLRRVLAQGSFNEPLAVVLNYDVLPYAIADDLKRIEWDALVCDECHRLKAASGKQSRICSQLADRSPRRLALTGTPMPHSPLDVYAQFRAVDKRVFGTSFVGFRSQYAVMGGFQGHQVVSYRNLDDLHTRMYTRCYRCRTEDVLDLPPFTDVNRFCELESASRTVYEDLKEELIAELEAGTVTADNALVKALRLAQVTNGFVKDDAGDLQATGDEKARLLEDVLEELRCGYDEQQEPVVVFGRFHADLDTIHTTAQGLGMTTAELSGRRNDLADWQAGSADVLAVQLQAGGVGIDLTRARYCVYYAQDWSLGNFEQSRARVHRPGQTRPVTYIHLIAHNTIDETIRKALARKANVVRFVIDELLGVDTEDAFGYTNTGPGQTSSGAFSRSTTLCPATNALSAPGSVQDPEVAGLLRSDTLTDAEGGTNAGHHR